MAKLYFKYGAMGSSKTAQVLITKFNYEERGMKVWLIKPALDDRDGATTIKSRIGLSAPCDTVAVDDDLFTVFTEQHTDADVVIADECQFFTEAHVDALRRIVDDCNIPVMCFGLRTDFLCHLFTGSKRLFEVADSVSEIKTICECGSKATVNARLDADMRIVTEGSQVMLGGNDCYVAMCHKCWVSKIRSQQEK
ncbi:MAG: thymidine kinase [Clostridia bacterium]|nr:thymidine kinase [Clostridia bacterium]